MKQFYLKTLLLCLFMLAGTTAHAYDAKVNGIYYNFNETEKTAEVTLYSYYSSQNKTAYSGAVVIPSTVTYGGTTYSVTSIGDDAFSDCSGLTSITIPESVTSIGYKAFAETKWYDELPDGLVYAGKVAYKYKGTMPENATIAIKEGTTSISREAFSNCSGLTSITIPNSVTSIGYEAFYDCNGLTSITIPNSVTTIGSSAFDGCSGLTSITIPNSVTSIGYSAFKGCENAKIYTKRGTITLLRLWDLDVEPYEAGTDNLLTKPSLKQLSSTQTTITVELENCYDEYDYTFMDKTVNKKQPTVLTGLKPGDSYSNLKVLSGNSSCSVELKSKVYTQNISPSIQSKQVTASSVLLKASYSEGDAKVVSQYFMVGKDKINGNNASIAGLDPNTSFTAKYVVEIKYGDNEQYTTTYSSNEQTIKTAALTLTTLQPKVATPGNVIVAAESNLDDAETNVGFEWRRTDWTDDFSSNSGGAFLYEGNMEGYIRNLNTDKLWKYRPYYESNSGKRYYGEWMGLDPTNTSFFEPTVHTYANVSVQGNQAEVKGYAMRGSDNVTSQGFFYWQQPAGVRAEAPGSVSVPKNAMKAEANGNIMTTTLEGLDYLTTYCYVAFMTTSEGDTFYGELRTFETGEDTSGIEDIPSATKTAAGTQKVYDLNGRRIAQPRRGLNIIRTADGSTVKVMKK